MDAAGIAADVSDKIAVGMLIGSIYCEMKKLFERISSWVCVCFAEFELPGSSRNEDPAMGIFDRLHAPAGKRNCLNLFVGICMFC